LACLFGCAKKAEKAMAPEEDIALAEKAEPEAAPLPTAPDDGVKYKRGGEGGATDRGVTGTTAPAEEAGEVALPEVFEPVPEAEAADLVGKLLLIKTASLTTEVENLDQGFEEAYAVAHAEKGLVVGTTRSVADEGYAFGSVTIKVHPAKYDETIRALRKIGRLVSENSTTEDITQEYVDIQARLENAERTRDRYFEILATRAGTVPEVLEVEREIERVTENIERFKGQLRYYDSQIGLSTITVNLEEPHAAVPTGYSFGKAVKDAFRIALRICIFLVQAVIVLLPFIILLIILVLIIRLIVWFFQRRRRKAKAAAA
jgi:hypothetical protein